MNQNIWILIEILLKFVAKGPINNIPALVQIMAWCQPGDKPLSEPMMISFWCIYASLSLNVMLSLFHGMLKYITLFAFFIISQNWHCTVSLNPFPQKTMNCLSCTANMTAVDDLATEGARASAAILLTDLSLNIPASAPEGKIKY